MYNTIFMPIFIVSCSLVFKPATPSAEPPHPPKKRKEKKELFFLNPCLSKAQVSTSGPHAHTDFATGALIIEGAESNCRKEDSNVEEDGCGHILQQGFITSNYT